MNHLFQKDLTEVHKPVKHSYYPLLFSSQDLKSKKIFDIILFMHVFTSNICFSYQNYDVYELNVPRSIPTQSRCSVLPLNK